MLVQPCNPSTPELEAGRQKCQGHSWLQSKCEASFGYMKYCDSQVGAKPESFRMQEIIPVSPTSFHWFTHVRANVVLPHTPGYTETEVQAPVSHCIYSYRKVINYIVCFMMKSWWPQKNEKQSVSYRQARFWFCSLRQDLALQPKLIWNSERLGLGAWPPHLAFYSWWKVSLCSLCWLQLMFVLL